MIVETINTGKLAEIVRSKRKEQGLSQKALGDMFSLSQTYVGWLEQGHVERLDEEKVRKILSFLKINLSDYTENGKKQVVNEKAQEVKKAPAPSVKTAVLEKKIPTPSAGSAILEKKVERAPYSPIEVAAPEKKVVSAPATETTATEKKTGQASNYFTRDRNSSGKEWKRFSEWRADKTRIGIKLLNGEVVEGYMKWWDTYTLKLVTDERDLVISKVNILYYIDAKKSGEVS